LLGTVNLVKKEQRQNLLTFFFLLLAPWTEISPGPPSPSLNPSRVSALGPAGHHPTKGPLSLSGGICNSLLNPDQARPRPSGWGRAQWSGGRHTGYWGPVREERRRRHRHGQRRRTRRSAPPTRATTVDAEVGAADAGNDGGQGRGIEGGQGRGRSSIPSTRRPGSPPPPLAQPPSSLAPLLQSDPASIWRRKDLDWLRYAV
jgi:hypothetical protein